MSRKLANSGPLDVIYKLNVRASSGNHNEDFSVVYKGRRHEGEPTGYGLRRV